MTLKQHKGWRLLVLCLLGVVALGGHALHSHLRGALEKEAPEDKVLRGTPVVLTPATLRSFERTVTFTGNLEAKSFVLVSPRVGGALEEIFVEEGDAVTAQETKLFQTDPLTLEKGLEIARQEHTVAQHAVREKKAHLERLQADFTKAEQDYKRGKELLAQKAISTSAFEEYESRYLQGLALIKHAKVLIALAQEQEIQARLHMDIAAKNLRDSLVMAPISGVVTERFREPGEMGESGKPVLRIENLEALEVAGFLPEEYFHEVLPGTTPVRVRVGTLELLLQKITYKSPTVDHTLRTFEVKVHLENPPSGVTPGRIAHLEVLLESHTALGVPREALVAKRSGRVLFVAEGERAREIPVVPGLETEGWVEIRETPAASEAASRDFSLKEGTSVVTQGQLFLEEGSLLAPVRGDN